MSAQLKPNSVVLITGGASGIGRAVAERLAAAGHTIAIVDRNSEQIRAVIEVLGADHSGHEADVASLDSLEQAVEQIMAQHGQIDVVIANAGIGSASTVLASSAEALERIISINLLGQIKTVKSALEQVIARRGFIMFTCSAAVLKNTAKSSAYAAAKAGVEAFAGSLRLEVEPHGVDVGVFYPGWTKTPMVTGGAARLAEGAKMPWPFNLTSTVEEVADAYAAAVQQRARSSYFPTVLRCAHILRPLFTGRRWDVRMRQQSRDLVASQEAGLNTGVDTPLRS
ncbi:SDR family NAD(P)-dependent oxidoreductase [Citricoccus sp. I39-566]|uniref:SDR family NAD(P)-dependent oxidoreductase n=1 Tax=Citricoccus sp. I39-566 TaxID=3073268 RepID=UPI00286BA20A|nr:SDR family NAD(P)-dependent oxidoreductase [Citricoccus sp. I39-566]WMY78561.1 SDR family NAD(P)-dependent oxidoreductase [Citricoccus sp. I39-566]